MSDVPQSQPQLYNYFFEMGYASVAVDEAISRFPQRQDLILDWLISRENFGKIPKKLKLDVSDTRTMTYYGSKVKYLQMPGTIDGFDITHSVVRFNPQHPSQFTRKWLHLSDSNLEWLTIHHNSSDVANTVPQRIWRRQVGSVEIPMDSALAAISEHEASGHAARIGLHPPTVDTEHLFSIWLKYGIRCATHRPLWRAINACINRHTHPPSGNPPRFSPRTLKPVLSSLCYSMDRCRHELRIELMSYFLTLCDFYAISMEKFTERLVQCSTADDFGTHITTLFPVHFDPQRSLSLRNNYTFLEMLMIWLDPTAYLTKEVHTYHSKCISLVDFELQPFDPLSFDLGATIKIKVFFHDMTFVIPQDQNKALIQRYFQVLFRRMYGNRNIPIRQTINNTYWHQTLILSKKHHQTLSQPSAIFVSELLPFQKKTLNWMQMRETSDLSLSSMGWERHQLYDGFTFYTDQFGSLSYSRPSDRTRGGILAQSSGMGKTIEMLALIASSTCTKPTLVILSPHMLKVWSKEAGKHVPSMNIRKYHGSARTLKNMTNVNVVFTTFRIVKNDKIGRNYGQILQSIDWGRVVIDDFDELADEPLYGAPLHRLHADFKWCMSANILRYGIKSVGSLFRFFNMTPFNKFANNDKQFNQDNGLLIREMLVEMTYSCEATDSDVCPELPLPVQDISVYQENKYSISYQHLINSIAKGKLDVRVDVLKSWLRWAAVHPLLVPLGAFAEKDTDAAQHYSIQTSVGDFLETVEDSSRKLVLQGLVESCSAGQEKCTICMDEIKKPTLTSCHHLFCHDCIQSCYEHDPRQKKCPLCRTSGVGSALMELTNGKVVEDLFFRLVERGRNFKIEKPIYEEIVAERAKNGSNKTEYLLQNGATLGKTVVYTSSWREMCHITDALRLANVSFGSISRFMNRKQRAVACNEFQKDAKMRFFLMEASTSDTENVLDSAECILFLQPCLSVLIRQLALNRVIRIGGGRPVKVLTLKTRNTIDETSIYETFPSLQTV
jgi:hypothetical protein